MNKLFGLMILTLALTGTIMAQQSGSPAPMGEMAQPGKQNTPVALKSGEVITRGAALTADAQKVALADVLNEPAKYAGKSVAVEGLIVRSCTMQGCWMELGVKAGGPSVHVTFTNEAFYIPLNAAGLKAKAEGVFSVKTLSKEQVDHLVNEDGAKFDKRNADGSVTTVSFEATGVELSKVE